MGVRGFFTMNFRTEIEKPKPTFLLNYQHKILALGSCFVDTIGKKLQSCRFKTEINPFGTIFNPHSIFKILDKIIFFLENKKNAHNSADFLGENWEKIIEQNAFVEKNGFWVHLDFHSDFFGETKEILAQKIILKIEEIANFLKTTNVLLLTLGTAWVYEHKFLQKIVSNCHHIPQKDFDKYLLQIPQITQYFDVFFEKIKNINPNIHTFLTLSPVRHQKDSLVLNQVSKSILRCAVYELCEKYPQNITYIPAYEILLDDLRDYRFYAEDLIHPSTTAENYIWDYVKTYFLDKKTNDFIQEWQEIQKNLSHKPRNPETESHQNFVKITQEKLKKFERNYFKE